MRGMSIVIAAIAMVAVCAPAEARDLTVVGWGGASQAAHKKNWDEFSQKTGIKVQEDSWNGGIGVLRAKVEAGNANWDVVQVEADEEMLGCEEGILEKLDYSKMGGREAFLDIASKDCGVGAEVWAILYGYDGDKLKDKQPQDWKDFWDLTKFPGKRGMRKTAKISLESALMADGVAPADVYKVLRTPEGVDRAFKKLDELRPNIVWYTSQSQVDTFLGSGEVVMSVAGPGRMMAFNKENKRNLRPVWKNNFYSVDYWVVLKNSPNRDKAMDLVAYLASPQAQLEYAQAFPSIGASNKEAIAKLSPDLAKLTPTAPEHLSAALFIDPQFWVENGDQLTQRFNAWAAR